MQWSRDVDLNDSSFQKQYERNLTRLETAMFWKEESKEPWGILKKLRAIYVLQDLQYVTSG